METAQQQLKETEEPTQVRPGATRLSGSQAPGSAASGLLQLSQQAGNGAVTALVQRAPAKTQGHDTQGHDAVFDTFLPTMVMHIDIVLSSKEYSRGDTAGLPDSVVNFLKHLYMAIYERDFLDHERSLSSSEQRESLSAVQAEMTKLRSDFQKVPGSAETIGRLDARLAKASQDITYQEIMDHSYHDIDLATALVSHEVVEAREKSLEVLNKAWEIYAKNAEAIEGQMDAVAATGGYEVERTKLSVVRNKISLAFSVVKATDPDTYRKLLKEAKEWGEEHGPGVVMGEIKGIAIAGELAELTVGTAVKVGTTLKEIFTKVLMPTGADLEGLEELSKTGELVSSGGKAVVWLGKAGEYLEKAEKVLAVVNLVTGIAKFATAENKEEHIDALVDIGSGVVGIGTKLAPRLMGGAGPIAFAVVATWAMAKFFGDMGAAAIEGFLYAGLREELKDIQALGDEVARGLILLDRALSEADRRFGTAGPTSESEGAQQAAEKLSYDLQKHLKAADARWRTTTIDALAKWYPTATKGNVAWAGVEDFPPDQVEAAGIEFLQVLTVAWKDMNEIAIQMAVDQGYMTEEDAERKTRALRREEAASAKEAAKGE